MILLQKLYDADDQCAASCKSLMSAHKAFGKYIAKNRKVSRSAFAKKLGITGAMLGHMEAGLRRWPIHRAELALKLLTRREDWPD
jgi:DNA-binding transcriptional regulator YiaG